MMFTRGEANLVVDESPYNLAYNFASVEAEPLLEEGTLLSDGSYISAVILPEPEIVPLIEEAKSEISVSASFENPPTQRFFSCINFIKEYWPEFKDKQLYSPRYLWQNYAKFGLERIDEPIVGALVVMLDNPYYGHIGVVEWVESPSFSLIEENLKPGKITHRTFEFENKNIIGYLK